MNQETKVGLFLLGALALILSSILFMGKIHLFKHTDKYYVEFTNVEALPPKAAVKIAGVEIGSVLKVELIQGKARVTIGIDSGIPVYANAAARIGSTGIIGTRFVELEPGTPDAGVLEPKSTIKGINSASIDKMISKLSALFEDDAQYGSATDNLKATLAHIRNVSASLDTAMGQRSQDLVDIVTNLKELTENAKVFTAHIEEITTEKKEDIKIAIDKFRAVGEKLDAILAKINRGEGTIGALVSDEKTAKDMKESIASIKDTATSAKKVLGRFTQINTFWEYRYRYDFRDEESKSDLGITFSPKPGKYYSLAATNLGDPISNEKHLVYERKNRFTATMGADYGPFTGYAGAIRSDGGFGLNFYPLWLIPKWGKRVQLNAEAADFDRDRVVQGEKLSKAWVATGAHVAVTRWWWVGVRGEDLLEHSAFMAYTNIVFRDEDLSYFFGFLSFAH